MVDSWAGWPTGPTVSPRVSGASRSRTGLRALNAISWSRCAAFFFQAEDGIRYDLVTGVQTCALPICAARRSRQAGGSAGECRGPELHGPLRLLRLLRQQVPPLLRRGRGEELTMKSLTVQICTLVLLATVFAAAQQRGPYSPSTASKRTASSSDSRQAPNWPGSQNASQLPAGTPVQIPAAPATSAPTASVPGPSGPAGSSPLTTRITAAPVELGPGDLMDIVVLDTPEVSGRFRVNSDGEITLPLIGAIPVKGLPPEQAQTLIAKKLVDGNFIKDPLVTVFVSEYASQMVYVLGEVKMPGAYPLMGSHR